MKAVRTSETSFYYESTRRYIPEGSHLNGINGYKTNNLKANKEIAAICGKNRPNS